jgi:membrane protein implicated in regulation of membrane protease activity
MDQTEWIVFVIVALAAIYLVWTFIRKKKSKGCCSGKGCGSDKS